jgi:site-specific DNA recombinase
MERNGLQSLLAAATADSVRRFDCILIDDSSRLTRRLADALNLFERLTFAGVRVVAVSQGVDTVSPQADLKGFRGKNWENRSRETVGL